MQPTGDQLQRIRDALVSAYSTYADLRMLARLHLDVDLDAIVSIQDRNHTQAEHCLYQIFPNCNSASTVLYFCDAFRFA